MWPFQSKEEKEQEKRDYDARVARIAEDRESLRTLEGIRAFSTSRITIKSTFELWLIIDNLAREIEELKEENKLTKTDR